MSRFHNILVGVDLSNADRLAVSDLPATTQHAIDRAVWLAAQVRAQLTFFSVIEISAQAQQLLDDDATDAAANVEQAANEVLNKLVDRAKAEGVDAQSKFVFGKDWIEIIRQVIRENHDLVIAGTRNLSGPRRLLFGSTGMNLLRNCPCPVWVTKPQPLPEVANILVASDLSEVSADALSLTVSAGQLIDAKIHLVHACEFKFDRRMWLTGATDDEIKAYHQKIRQEAEETLNEHLARTDYRTLTYGVQIHVIDGPSDVVILEAIEEFDINLAVMGTVARHGIPGLLIGNTAERLFAEMPCSLLAVKPADFQCPVRID